MGALAHSIDLTSPPPGFWQRYFAPPCAGRSQPRWHVSPAIDIAAYHFSWAWVLIPMMLASRESTIFYIYALVMAANLAHRHYGLPYAYLDREVFHTYERKLTWFPEVCLLLFAATPLLLSLKGVAAGAVGAVVFFSLLWNFWHTYMQKFGVLRLYRAKDPAAVQERTPGWIDRYLMLCWVPLYFTYLGPKYKDLIFANGNHIRGPAAAIIALMEMHGRALVLPSVVIAAGGAGHDADFVCPAVGQSGQGLYRLRVQPCRRVHGLRVGVPAPPICASAPRAVSDRAGVALSQDLVPVLHCVLCCHRNCADPVGPGVYEGGAPD